MWVLVVEVFNAPLQLPSSFHVLKYDTKQFPFLLTTSLPSPISLSSPFLTAIQCPIISCFPLLRNKTMQIHHLCFILNLKELQQRCLQKDLIWIQYSSVGCNSHYDVGSVHSDKINPTLLKHTHTKKRALDFAYLPCVLIEPCQYPSAFSIHLPHLKGE